MLRIGVPRYGLRLRTPHLHCPAQVLLQNLLQKSPGVAERMHVFAVGTGDFVSLQKEDPTPRVFSSAEDTGVPELQAFLFQLARDTQERYLATSKAGVEKTLARALRKLKRMVRCSAGNLDSPVPPDAASV